MLPNKIPPRSEWKDLTIGQLYDVKTQVVTTYQNLRSISASFAPQYLQFVSELDSIIARKEEAERTEREDQG